MSSLSKLDKNAHFKRNCEPSSILNSFGELNSDRNVIALCLLNFAKNDDDEQSFTIIIKRY